jgi:CheY-like chemotaxis protein
MTTGKRALIVDDSRSARVILSRMLEQHGMVVDTAESAEQALEYLQQGRPDVIFMDHLMPGMDGFQAVQAIKSDVQTATIPLMMYTSQEGELYVSQARALGAIGVLPKTVRPVDVSRVLYQLHLLPDRRQQRTTLFERAAATALSAAQPALAPTPASQEMPLLDAEATPDETAAAGTAAWSGAPVAALAELHASLRQSIQQLVKDQLADQRRFMLATFEAFARRLGSEIKENTPPKAPAVAAVETLPIEPQPRQWWPVVLTALLAVIPAVVLGALYWRALDENRAVARQVTELRTEITDLADKVAAMPPPMTFMSPSLLPAIPQPLSSGAAPIAAAPASAIEAAPLAIEYVPFGETPLANGRLDRLRAVAAPLEAQRTRARIVVESYVGDFCLTGSPADGFTVAEPSVPFQKCDMVGNPFDDSLAPAQRQSVDFANFAASLRKRTGGAVVVETVSAGRRSPVEYPEQAEGSTAGAWNTVAAQNNRVEFRVVRGD